VIPLRLELPTPASGRLAILDELKGVAIIFVVLYHAGGVLALADRLHFETGVDMFVILSGVGLALSTKAESPGRFLARRFMRILPLYWTILTAVLLGGWFILGIRYYTVLDNVMHYLGVHAFFGDWHALAISDSFWFITLILFLYCLYAAMWRLRDRPDWMLCISSIVSFALAMVYFETGQSDCFAHFALRIPGFFIGLLGGELLKTGKLDVPLTAPLGCAFLVLFYLPYTQGFIFASFFVGVAVIAAYAFLVRTWVSRPARTFLKFLGDHSLEIFLIHQPIIREYNLFVLRKLYPNLNLDGPEGFWPLTVGIGIGLVVTFELSILLHRFFARLPIGGSGRFESKLA
jgi:peptidoglycan/LPS O-acetylase OafA/YrhL